VADVALDGEERLQAAAAADQDFSADQDFACIAEI